MSWKARALTAVLLLFLTVLGTGCATAASSPSADVVTVGTGTIRAIPAGFVGLSMEYTGLSAYVGDNPAAPNPIFEQLVRGLAPGQSPVLRIGGDSTDWAWSPIPGVARPAGMRITLDRRWLAVAHTLAKDLNARLILGVNLEADNARIAAAMAQALLNGIGRPGYGRSSSATSPSCMRALAGTRPQPGERSRGAPVAGAFRHMRATSQRSPDRCRQSRSRVPASARRTGCRS